MQDGYKKAYTVKQMYELNDSINIAEDDEITSDFKKWVNSLNERKRANVSTECIFADDISNKEDCKKEYWFLVCFGRNGSIESFAYDVLQPLMELLVRLELDGCEYPTVVDAEFENCDSMYHFVINTAK